MVQMEITIFLGGNHGSPFNQMEISALHLSRRKSLPSIFLDGNHCFPFIQMEIMAFHLPRWKSQLSIPPFPTPLCRIWLQGNGNHGNCNDGSCFKNFIALHIGDFWVLWKDLLDILNDECGAGSRPGWLRMATEPAGAREAARAASRIGASCLCFHVAFGLSLTSHHGGPWASRLAFRDAGSTRSKSTRSKAASAFWGDLESLVFFFQLVPHHHEMFPDWYISDAPFLRVLLSSLGTSMARGAPGTLCRHDQPGRDTQALPPDLEQLQTTPEMLLLQKEEAWSVSLQTRKASHGAPAAVSATTAARRHASSALSLRNTTLCDCTIPISWEWQVKSSLLRARGAAPKDQD